ncbi:MAG: hypothetical protein IT297_07210 [Anaerolineae bacterium]|jgi:hypothetical protein|nr:hypothetical protein [Anaerolineae bacterium]MCZ7553850.1 NBR1-Ig-like domain-containing protein [Anaerolineales bacterium]
MRPHINPKPLASALATLLLAAILLSACNLPGKPAGPDLDTIVAQTKTAMAVNLFLTATAQPAPTEVPPATAIPTAEATPVPPSEVQPTPAPTEAATIVTPPATSLPGCVNLAKLVEETVPDLSIFGPNQEFIKTWTLRNVGTCVWNPAYSLVSIGGERMSGTSPVPIGQTVPPGNTLQIFLPQTAPANPGVFQGDWMLRSTDGVEFGLGSDAKTPFWVKIQVVQGANPTVNPTAGSPSVSRPQNLGDPSWTVGFGSDRSPFFLGTDSGMNYNIADGKLVITALKPTGDQWRVAQASFLDNFYLQTIFMPGSICNGKDGYGMLVRAPSKPDGNINSGYVFSFSCDGKYRVYRMDNGNFNNIQNWTTNPAIHPGANQTNVMGISAVGAEFQFYANNTLLYSFTDGTYSGGLYGLAIRAESAANFSVAVDEIAGWVIR